MEDKNIAEEQYTYIASLIERNKNVFEPYLSNKVIDTNKIKTFTDWVCELSKEQASNLIIAMEDENATLFEYVLRQFGYYRWIEYTEPVDELAYARGDASTDDQYDMQFERWKEEKDHLHLSF